MKHEKSLAAIDGNEIALVFSEDLSAVAGEPGGVTGNSAGIVAAEAARLTGPQLKAIELLVSGHSVLDAALAAGVGRATLYRWLKKDAAFMAAYNAWQRDVIDTARGRLLSLSNLAVTAVEKSLEKADARTAMKVLEKLGVLDRPAPGPTDPAEVERQRRVDDQRARSRLDQAEMDVKLPWMA